MSKVIFFVIATILLLIMVYIEGMRDNWLRLFFYVLLYGVFVLVSLYELGRVIIEKEENENRDNR
jgi:hypothetical protein